MTPFTCRKCGKIFKKPSYEKFHDGIKTHKKRCCPFCNCENLSENIKGNYDDGQSITADWLDE